MSKEIKNMAGLLADRIRTEGDNLDDAALDDAPEVAGNPVAAIHRDELARWRFSYITLCWFAAVACGIEDMNDLTFGDIARKADEIAGRQSAELQVKR